MTTLPSQTTVTALRLVLTKMVGGQSRTFYINGYKVRAICTQRYEKYLRVDGGVINEWDPLFTEHLLQALK